MLSKAIELWAFACGAVGVATAPLIDKGGIDVGMQAMTAGVLSVLAMACLLGAAIALREV